jgi:WD40 repeat protein
MRCRKSFLTSFAATILLLSTVSCSLTPNRDFDPTQPHQPTSPSAEEVATTEPPEPPEPTERPAALSLGQPVWVGRGKIVSAVFLPGARQIAIGWGNGVSLNTVDTGQELWFQTTPSNVIAFDAQPQGQAFAAALADGNVMIFEAASGRSRRFQGAKPDAYWGDIAWSPDGRTLAFQYIGPGRSDPIYLLDVASGQVREAPESQTGEGVIPNLVWSPDGSSILVAALGDDFPRFVDIETGQERMRLGQPGQVISSAPLFLADGKTIVSEGPAGDLDVSRFPEGAKLRTLASDSRLLGRRLVEFPNAGGPLFTDPTGQWIAVRGGYEPCYCGSADIPSQYPLIVWDLERGVVIAQLNQALDALASRHRLAAAFDGDSILMFYESGEITRWAFRDAQAQEAVAARVPVRPVSSQTLTWSADGSHLAFSGMYGGVDVYDATGRLAQRFDPPLTSPALSPEGHLVAMFNPNQNAVVIYRVQDNHLVRMLPVTPTSPLVLMMGAAFSPDGGSLAYGVGNQAAVIELASGRVIPLDPAAIVPAQADLAFTRMIWSPDGQSLITGIVARSSITSTTASTSTLTSSTSRGVIVLWKRLADGSFTVVDHVGNAQAGDDSPPLALAAYDATSRWVALQALPDNEAGLAAINVYDLQTGKLTQTLAGYRLGTWFSEEELLAVEAQYATRLTLINVMDGRKTIAGSIDIGAVAYSSRGDFIAQVNASTGRADRSVTIRRWQDGEVVLRVPYGSVDLLDYRWSPDGRWFAMIGNDHTLRIWPVRPT